MKVIRTPAGRMVFAVLCDGMGGLSSGEVASATVVKAFHEWVVKELPGLCMQTEIMDSEIKSQWEKIITQQNEKIKSYGARQGSPAWNHSSSDASDTIEILHTKCRGFTCL